MPVIATICARGGSQGVPGKNIKDLMGKPLIAHTIEQALACKKIDEVFVSTDSEDIAEVARAAGAKVPFIRPAELATSSAAKIPVIQHLVDHVINDEGMEVEKIVDLDPTSPLRELSDVEACIDLLDSETDCVITAFEAEKNPYFNMVEEVDGNIQLVKKPAGAVVARQAAPNVYSMNASIYVWRPETLSKGLWDGKIKMHIMPRERSIDIDAPLDFKIVELLMKEKQANG